MRVSGFRRSDGVIDATRVERVASLPEVGVLGRISKLEGRSFEVNGVKVRLAPKVPLEGLAEGIEVQACGEWTGEHLLGEDVYLRPAVPFAGRLPHLSLQGYVGEPLAGNRFELGRLQVEVSPNTRIDNGTAADLRTDQRVRVQGSLASQQLLKAERIEVERALPQARTGRGTVP